ncbi:hypothetical protein A3C23_02380 [Candidatus Roizmanbacteria bacterium RIFCSPHIGHO2_02_FULL_37_13b]|nr:MAG: hypothetical protein A3C23_02380 [Candidatus Roizmanbacteria bacterium RIFCSPHIGHO2_02_FULL_37_13b]
MALNIIIILVILLCILWSFTSRRFSPIPYFPTNKKDINLIIDVLLNDPSNSAIIDLGAGTGTVIFPTALKAYRQKLKTKFIAIEIHPLLLLIMHLKCLFHPNKRNIYIIRGDIFKMNFNKMLLSYSALNPQSSTLYLYVGREALHRLKPQLDKLPAGTRIVSYMYPLKGWSVNKILSGYHQIFIYII